MVYRTKTYIAADWDKDIDAVIQLHKWNDSNYYSKLDFFDVHKIIQARDTSLYCSIKSSLRIRMNMCKTFILIVGSQTNQLRKGSCQYCDNYINSCYTTCLAYHPLSFESYIAQECRMAVKNNLNIVVLYNSNHIDKQLCPEIIRDKGIHVPMKLDGEYYYPAVRDALIQVEL